MTHLRISSAQGAAVGRKQNAQRRNAAAPVAESTGGAVNQQNPTQNRAGGESPARWSVSSVLVRRRKRRREEEEDVRGRRSCTAVTHTLG
ncbi:hypothetical protein EYF80_041984 [Liparis tanakae]|uniref:Uncharacterized protein n=1 Tax=Liparis tanakae TaxID=230148 RepID=A0A4Z2G3G1_9TELE|nr:hypothetical protein EYF80_041984 [Liparis tanakae]